MKRWVEVGQPMSNPVGHPAGMTSELLLVPVETRATRRNDRGAGATALNPRRRSRCSDQMDFALPGPVPISIPATRRNVAPRPCSRERAAWWFEQMRRAVDADR
jgi:hypothetical protein